MNDSPPSPPRAISVWLVVSSPPPTDTPSPPVLAAKASASAWWPMAAIDVLSFASPDVVLKISMRPASPTVRLSAASVELIVMLPTR